MYNVCFLFEKKIAPKKKSRRKNRPTPKIQYQPTRPPVRSSTLETLDVEHAVDGDFGLAAALDRRELVDRAQPGLKSEINK